MVKTLNIRINQFSKKQMGWFRKMEREGFKINWVDKSQRAIDAIEIAQKVTGKKDSYF